MTAAQKIAKDKFKQAIAYRQKTGVSLKEAFAHIYGKKIANTRKLVFDYLEVPKGKVPKVVKIIGNINNFKANIWGIQLGFVEVKANNEIYLQLMDLTNNKPIIKFIPGLSSKEIDAYAYDISEYIKYYSNQSHTYTELESLKSKLKKWSRLIDKEVNKLNKKSTKMPIKKAAPKKKIAKKVVRKIVKKKAAPKKVAKKKLTKQDYDKRYQAKKPGKRTSASGNTYYESRPNRSDKGKLLGIGNVLNKNQEIKRLSQLAKTPLEKRIVSILKYNLQDYDNLKSLIKDVLYNGLQSGIISDLIYYNDTLAFYKRYKKEIDVLLKDVMNESGANSPANIFGKKWDNEDWSVQDTNNRNLLAWFGFEEKTRELADKLGYEI